MPKFTEHWKLELAPMSSKACRRKNSWRSSVRFTLVRNASQPRSQPSLAEHYSDEALTDREIEVLRQIAEGNRNRDIADKLFITEETVKVHIKHIMEKLGATDRTQAVAIGVRRGIIQL
jgi:DNA-binding NarL/FixJ family response regulator